MNDRFFQPMPLQEQVSERKGLASRNIAQLRNQNAFCDRRRRNVRERRTRNLAADLLQKPNQDE